MTFKTKHPTIEEITKGDKFITRDNTIVEFYIKDANGTSYNFIFKQKYPEGRTHLRYLSSLYYLSELNEHPNDIIKRYDLRFKLNQL